MPRGRTRWELTQVACVPPVGPAELFAAGSQTFFLYMGLDVSTWVGIKLYLSGCDPVTFYRFVPTFHRNLPPPSSRHKTREAAFSSDKLVYIYKITWHYILEIFILQATRPIRIKSALDIMSLDITPSCQFLIFCDQQY
jgi:hypothetical protein